MGPFCFFFIIDSEVNTWLSRLNKAYSQGIVVLLDPSIVFCCPFFYSARCILGCFIFLCLPCMYIVNLKLGSVTPRAQLIGFFFRGVRKKRGLVISILEAEKVAQQRKRNIGGELMPGRSFSVTNKNYTLGF
jgi:hypothetical protein